MISHAAELRAVVEDLLEHANGQALCDRCLAFMAASEPTNVRQAALQL